MKENMGQIIKRLRKERIILSAIKKAKRLADKHLAM